MDLDTEDECLSLNLFSQDAQHRSRKSQIAQISHKKVKVIRTSALLVIDQLKNGFRRLEDFTPRMQTRRNWRPELLIKSFYDNRRGCKEKCVMIMQHDKSRSRNFISEPPKIYSIGLHCGARSLDDNNDLWSSCDLTRNFKKRLNIICRPTICKYWIAQSTPTLNLTDVFLKTHTNHQTMIINRTELMDILKHNRTQKNNHYSYHNQSHQHIEKKNDDYISDSLRDNHAANNRSFISNNFIDFSMKKDDKCDKSCVIKKDAQIQTSSRKSLRRKKTKEKSKSTNKEISHHKCCDDKPYEEFIANFHAGLQNSNKKKCYEKLNGSLSVRVLENKRAEYINKFTAVNRRIEEITATLRETCYSDKNSRSNLENHEKCFPLIFDNARVNSRQELNENSENKSIIAKKRNISKKKHSSINIKKIIKKSENNRHKKVPEILYSDNINNKSLILDKEHPKDTLASSINSNRSLNDTFVCDSIEALTIKKTVHPSNRTCAKKKKVKCHSARHISLDSNLTKDDDKFQEFFIKDEFFDEVYPRNNFVILSDNTYAKSLMKDFADLEELKCRKKIVESAMGEMAILEDIKRRIDRDFDDPLAEKNENDVEDFVTVSQKSSNLDHQFYEVASVKNMAMEESKFTPLIASTNINSVETQIRDTNSINDSMISAGAMSEHSNKNSTLSKYFSCTQFSSLISLTKNEDEFALGIEDQNTYDSCSNIQSNSYYYDLDYDSKINYSGSNLNMNNCSCSNLDSSFDVARYDTCTPYISPNKFLIKTISKPNDTFEVSEGGEGFAENKICREHLYRKNKRKSRVELEKRYTADSTLETSKSSRCIGSIDSGVFSSSLIDFYPPESFFNTGESELKKKRARKLDVSSPAFDFSSDDSCTDDTLDRKVDDIVRSLTKNLILCERRTRIKLKEMRKAGFKARNAHYPPCISSNAYKFSRSLCDIYYDFFNSPRPSSEDERIVNISTPSLLSLSDSEISDRESKCPL
ncbi:uncharacterized protein MAL13P1.304-like isoform X2 [Linepithema humile]|uniref:uncharacterized protein MAL13P1.304-like isoform X2 n=1 Tax=Linepithema humile TaxID=83485 RepID=UPI00351DDE8A